MKRSIEENHSIPHTSDIMGSSKTIFFNSKKTVKSQGLTEQNNHQPDFIDFGDSKQSNLSKSSMSSIEVNKDGTEKRNL
jgi:hypothetical protein